MREPAVVREALNPNGVTGMTDTPAPVIELAEAEALRSRVRARKLEGDDYSLVEHIITSWIELSAALDDKDATRACQRLVSSRIPL